LADEINAYLVLGQDSQQGGNNKENKQKLWWNKYTGMD
jgi:hypothetical protein